MAYGDGPADEALRDAWDRFCDQLKDAGQQVFKDANPRHSDPACRRLPLPHPEPRAGVRSCAGDPDPAYPQIHPFCTPTRKLGGDVADFTYRQAWIDGNHAYRVTGRRGTARWFNMTVQGPRPETIPGTDWPRCTNPSATSPRRTSSAIRSRPTPKAISNCSSAGEARGDNWLPTTPGSRKLFIREAFDAWFETPTTLTIERIGMDGPRPMPTAERMIEAMGWAGEFLTGAMRDWPEHSWRYSGGVCDPALRQPVPAGPNRRLRFRRQAGTDGGAHDLANWNPTRR